MRVIGGIAKKRHLKSPGKLPVRPTADRVKESLFNILGSRIPGSIFADLFAGIGGVGIEALSRGANKVVFIEKKPIVARILKENINLTGLSEGAEIIVQDVEIAIKLMKNRKNMFDIIFFDPPYRQGLAIKTLNTLSKYPILHNDGIAIAEVGADEEVPKNIVGFTLFRREKYGDTMLVFYKPEKGEDKFCE